MRNVGSDGGQTLEWEGRIVVVGAVTTAWDAAHGVISVLGDRFILCRIDSKLHRVEAGMRAIGNTGNEVEMRAELADAVGGLLAQVNTEKVAISESETEQLVKIANIVTMARTAVERDYQGNVTDAHAPEMPTRFAKQLAQVVRGSIAIGMSRKEGMRLAIRCARDSIPPLRLEIMVDLIVHPGMMTADDVRGRINKPRTTVWRELEALHMLGIVTCEEEEIETESFYGGVPKTKRTWSYSLSPKLRPRYAVRDGASGQGSR